MPTTRIDGTSAGICMRRMVSTTRPNRPSASTTMRVVRGSPPHSAIEILNVSATEAETSRYVPSARSALSTPAVCPLVPDDRSRSPDACSLRLRPGPHIGQVDLARANGVTGSFGELGHQLTEEFTLGSKPLA